VGDAATVVAVVVAGVLGGADSLVWFLAEPDDAVV
jgi:hypothetical protein